MTLKFENSAKTAASFNGSNFTLTEPEDWSSIGDGPTREAVTAWLAAGNKPESYASPVPAVPQSVTPRQARLALLQVGLLGQVDAIMAAMPAAQQAAARIEWEHCLTVERGSPLVAALAQGLGLPSHELDQLFITAATL